MRINHNIAALKANNALGRTTGKLDKSLEKLSSGYRINSAGDDAAGLAISQKMDTQIRGLEQASRNASDGISVIQTAEGALGEVHSMLQRMRELAVEVSNGTYDAVDRSAVQDEIDQLNEEIQRVSDTTEFNEKKLLNGDLAKRNYSSDNNVNVLSVSKSVQDGTYALSVTSAATKAGIYVSGNTVFASLFKSGLTMGSATISGGRISGATVSSDLMVQKGLVGKVNINGEEITIEAEDTVETIMSKLRTACDNVQVDFEFNKETGAMAFVNRNSGSDYGIEINMSGNVNLLFGEMKKIESIDNDKTTLSDKYKVTGNKLDAGTKIVGEDAKVNLDTSSGFSKTATWSSVGNIVTITDTNGFEMRVQADAKTNKVKINVLDVGPMDLQIGANEGQFMRVAIARITPETLGIADVNMATSEGAQIAIGKIDDAINMVSNTRSALGAYQNRLEHAIANIDTTTENMTESMSRIMDADMATEMSDYTQQNVLQQAGTSMLAKANQRPDTIIQLLQQ